MARTDGSKNRSYGARRRAPLLAVRDRPATPNASRSSTRDLAKAADLSIATLRQYFPSREDLIVAVMAENLAHGRAHLHHVATPQGAFAASLPGFVALGFTPGLGQIHTFGLTEGLREPTIGPGYVDHVSEPSIAAVRHRLDAHVEAGEVRSTNTRHAAIVLLSPIILLMLHQHELGGATAQHVAMRRRCDRLFLPHIVNPDLWYRMYRAARPFCQKARTTVRLSAATMGSRNPQPLRPSPVPRICHWASGLSSPRAAPATSAPAMSRSLVDIPTLRPRSRRRMSIIPTGQDAKPT